MTLITIDSLHYNMTALWVICILVKIATFMSWFYYFKNELYYVFYTNKKLFIDKNKESFIK